MGSNKHKHKSRKKKHYRSSDSSEREYERDKHRHHKRHKDRKEKPEKPILVDDYDSSNSEDDVIIVSTPPPPKISHQILPKRKSSESPRRKITKNSHVSPPPPPKIGRHKSPLSPSENKGTSDASLSIEETNKLRLKLGLKPLEVNSERGSRNENQETKETFGGTDMGDFVHKPPENISVRSYTDKLKEKLKLQREKREIEEKLWKVKKLNEESDDDDVTKWVEKNRKISSERQQAKIRAKELDALDEVFGIGELIEEDMRANRNKAYTAKHLKGLKVEHEMDAFKEGMEVVLTLKDKGVLDDEVDTLVNVNIVDDERYKKNIDRRRQIPGYNAYEDDITEMETSLEKNVLQKYDEEIHGEMKKTFQLGISKEAMQEARKESIRNKLQQYAVGKRLENLSFSMQPATDYFTGQEISAKFKKIKKKVRKVRKVKPLKADDLLTDNLTLLQGSVKREVRSNISNEQNWARNGPRFVKRIKTEVKEEPYNDPLDVDDLPPPPSFNTESMKIDINEDEDMDLQLALRRTRKLRKLDSILTNNDKIVTNEDQDEKEDKGVAGSIVLNATAEFCRTLGDIPTYGQAGNREEDAQELMDCERELKPEKLRTEDFDALTSGWNEVASDVLNVDIATAEVPILDAEPDICKGVAGALKMAIHKGYIQTETEKRPSASRFAHLQAQNYSIEDKTHAYEDDKHARRERYSTGMTSEFKDKEGYKPNVKLEYIDDDGHLLTPKEAFRYLSHKFHGKGPGKNKIEKRMKKSEQEALMKQMSSTDTPLGTLNMLQQKQKETQSPFVVLSGTKQGQSTNIAKLRF